MKYGIAKTTEREKTLPWLKCLCGGAYCLHTNEQGLPMLLHSMPPCERYANIETTEQAVEFSQANRGVS